MHLYRTVLLDWKVTYCMCEAVIMFIIHRKNNCVVSPSLDPSQHNTLGFSIELDLK